MPGNFGARRDFEAVQIGVTDRVDGRTHANPRSQADVREDHSALM